MPRIVVAGTSSGVGKTTVATGLMAALAARGRAVAGFKVGPDFIDPGYHQLATGRPARNLDAFLSGEQLVAPLFAHGAGGADVAVVEGVMGLFDGRSGTAGFASTAHVARLLDAPVVLVVDASSMARSVAAMVHGYATFDPAVRVAGVVLNRVASGHHELLLRAALEPLGLPVLGVLARDASMATPSRHLGLVPVAERTAEAARMVAGLGGRIAAAVDLDAVERLAATAPRLEATPWDPSAPGGQPRAARAGSPPVAPPADSPAAAPADRAAGSARIAVAAGPAFSFVYTENLELLRAAGAELAPFDPTRDPDLPEGTTGLYLAGGFPETHAEVLSANAPLRAEVAALAARGHPILAECGGLLYLCERLEDLPMCGLLPATARMTTRLHLGYRTAQAASDSPLWRRGEEIAGHEFHYSQVDPASGAEPAWTLGGHGASAVERRQEGFVSGSVHASYLHTHWAATPDVAVRLVRAAESAAMAQAGQAAAPPRTAGAPA